MQRRLFILDGCGNSFERRIFCVCWPHLEWVTNFPRAISFGRQFFELILSPFEPDMSWWIKHEFCRVSLTFEWWSRSVCWYKGSLSLFHCLFILGAWLGSRRAAKAEKDGEDYWKFCNLYESNGRHLLSIVFDVFLQINSQLQPWTPVKRSSHNVWEIWEKWHSRTTITSPKH